MQLMGPTTVPFYQPFAEPPTVNMLHVGRTTGPRPRVSEVTNVHVEFSRNRFGYGVPNTFVWIAQGRPLQALRDTLPALPADGAGAPPLNRRALGRWSAIWDWMTCDKIAIMQP